MIQKRFRGFTLIELLVVIAIIGILSAVVLASLNTARSKGNDAAVQSDLSTVQTQAEIFYGTSNDYGDDVSDGSCTATAGTLFADPTIANAIAGAKKANGNNDLYCSSTGAAYMVSAPLSTSGRWCIDSTGVARQTSTSTPTGVTCPAS